MQSQQQFEPINDDPIDNNEDENLINEEERFHILRDLADTLQGRIYGAIDRTNGNYVVIKESWIHLLNTHKSRAGHNVSENFQKEIDIMRYLSLQPDCHPGIVRIIHSWNDTNSRFYAMEGCKAELFDFIKNGDPRYFPQEDPNLVQQPMAIPNDWIKIVCHIFRQLVDCVSWLHQKGVCHLDLSLENTMIYDTDNFLIKIIDFGLALYSSDGNFFNDARVGKTGYMAPEVYSRQRYDAKKADIWSLGVMLFMMLIRAPPYEMAHRTDTSFLYLINGNVRELLRIWKRLNYVTPDALDLMEQIFKREGSRISMEEIRKHPFVQLDIEVDFEQNENDPNNDEVMRNNQNQNENDNNNNNNNDNNFHYDGEEKFINNPDDVKNNDNNEQLDIRNYEFKSSEAKELARQIFQINQEATIKDLANFVNQIELAINTKVSQQQELQQHDKQKEDHEHHEHIQDVNVGENIEELQLSLSIKELTLLQQYITDKIINLQNAKPLSITDSIAGSLRHIFSFF